MTTRQMQHDTQSDEPPLLLVFVVLLITHDCRSMYLFFLFFKNIIILQIYAAGSAEFCIVRIISITVWTFHKKTPSTIFKQFKFPNYIKSNKSNV